MAAPASLLHLLKKDHDEHHVIYPPGFSNHLSHALISLFKLEAPQARLQQFYDEYSTKLDKLPPSEKTTVNEHTWKQYVGAGKFYTEYLHYFDDQLKAKGIKETLNAHIPHLLSGVSSHAFHPAITIGFALEIMDPTHVAVGLAYWCHSFKPLGEMAEPSNSVDITLVDPISLFKRAHTDHSLHITFGSEDGFGTRFEKVNRQLAEPLKKYDINLNNAISCTGVDSALAQFARAAIYLFAYTGCKDFFLLHAVTGYRAVRNIVLELNDTRAQRELLRYLWRAAMVVYITQNRLPLEKPRLPPAPTVAHARALRGAHPSQEAEWRALIEKEYARERDPTYFYAVSELYKRLEVNKEGWKFDERD